MNDIIYESKPFALAFMGATSTGLGLPAWGLLCVCLLCFVAGLILGMRAIRRGWI